MKEYKLIRYIDMYPSSEGDGMLVETMTHDGGRLFIDLDDFNKAYALRCSLSSLPPEASMVVWSDEEGKIYFEEKDDG